MKGYKKDKAKKIRDEILTKLSIGLDLKFSNLQIKNVDSNLFTYHLKNLINENLIYKNGLKYNLTDTGKNYVESLSGKTREYRQQPKINNLIILQNKQKEFLIYKKRKHPFLAKNTFVYGKMHAGESIIDSAKRELFEKTGLETKLSFRGCVYLRIKDKNKILNHFLFNIFYGKEDITGKLVENFYGEFEFKKIEKAETEFMPGTLEILKLVENRKSEFFEDIEVQITK